jgi:hypothetical protein
MDFDVDRFVAETEPPPAMIPASFASSCPRCGHEAQTDTALGEGVFKCGVCHTRIAFGQVVPRVVIQPGTPSPKFVTVSFDGTPQIVDCEHAFRIAYELLSIMPKTNAMNAALAMLRMYKPGGP